MARRTRVSGMPVVFVLGVTLGVVGCAATYQARRAEPSGFLGDYSMLEKGKKDEALLVYQCAGVAWAKYDKVLFDPITIWHTAEVTTVDPHEAQVLADYLHSAIHNALTTDYTFVDRPGPGVLRLRVAITEAEGSKRTLDTVSTLIPQLRLLSGMKRIATGTAAFVGRAGIEGEVLDAMTNQRLFAAVDRRAGQNRLQGSLSTWDDVQQAFDYWGGRIRARLAELRDGAAASR